MNNNDILNSIYTDTERIEPTSKLNPASIENTLKGVKRKSYKGVVGSCVTLGIACICTGAIVISQVAKPVQTSYDDIYKIVEGIKKENEVSVFDKFGSYLTGDFEGKYENYTLEESLDSFATNSTTGTVDVGATEFSTTNVQVEGVDEADVVKTDGKYIYSVNDNKISIANSNNGKPEFVSSIEVEYTINDIYISNDKLVAVTEIVSDDDETSTEIFGNPNRYRGYITSLVIYDISDVKTPEQISVLSERGKCLSSRKIGDVVYLNTSYSIDDYRNIKKENPETYCPTYSVNGEEKCVPANSIVTCDDIMHIEYVTVASVDLNNPNDFADTCSVFGGSNQIYSSLNNIYVTSYCPIDSQPGTEIVRISLNGPEIEESGTLFVQGTILNQFSMDEHDGYFRVVTEFTPTQVYEEFASVDLSDTTTALYIYDENLDLVGKTDAVAEGEDVKSVRFDGDTAYFVTFRQTDPLFTVDLSDPTNPKILSELKIPGFSKYLHVMSEDLLLGFGREADPRTGVTEGLKLSMFDISDKTNVTEKTTFVFANDGAYSEAENNHKAIYVDNENKIIGIPYVYYLNSNDIRLYSIFKYDENTNEFVLLNEIGIGSTDMMRYNSSLNYETYSRGLRIGEYFYIVTNKEIHSYSYSDFQEVSSLTLE